MIRPNYWGVVMLFKVLSSAVLACVLSTTLVQAQSLANIGGPANLPPAGFAGQQFVDARGCLYLRAGFGATINWVPRVDRSRKPICGMVPSFGPAVAAAVEADMVPEPRVAAPVVAAPVVVAPVVVAPPRPPVIVAAAPEVVAQPAARRVSFFAALFGTPRIAATAPQVVVAPAQPAYRADQTAAVAAGQTQCFTSAPRLERVLLRSGGTALVCTRGDGTLTGWRSPLFPAGDGFGAALNAQMMEGATVMGQNPVTATARVARAAIPTPPAGYKAAWTDDRLNPMRGVGTASGQAQQDQVWTRDIPAQLVADQPQPRVVAAPAKPRTTVSTMSAPQADGQASYVQVGIFGQPANADGVKARLSALGLPVSTSRITRSGKELQIVYAGPFATSAEAQAALTAARNAGFGDAILK